MEPPVKYVTYLLYAAALENFQPGSRRLTEQSVANKRKVMGDDCT
jgi:hypothetical protein